MKCLRTLLFAYLLLPASLSGQDTLTADAYLQFVENGLTIIAQALEDLDNPLLSIAKSSDSLEQIMIGQNTKYDQLEANYKERGKILTWLEAENARQKQDLDSLSKSMSGLNCVYLIAIGVLTVAVGVETFLLIKKAR